jgi:hypothetical protein
MGARRPRLGMAGRLPMRSPGRPPVARREHRFWKAIAHGLSSEDAAVVGGVSQAAGARWFRQVAACQQPVWLAVGPLPVVHRARGDHRPQGQGCGVPQIARRVGRSASTISRELRRNAATRGGLLKYRATTAPWHADRRARRPKVAKLAGHDTRWE